MSDEVVEKDTNEAGEKIETITNPVAPIVFMDEGQTADIEIDVISDSSTGKISYVFPKGTAKPEDEKFFSFTPFKFTFSAPNWEQVSLYRQRSSMNPQGRLDKNTFRTHLLINHLKSWDIKDSKGNVVELDFDAVGELTKESLVNVNRVPPVILDCVMVMVEREFGLGSSQ